MSIFDYVSKDLYLSPLTENHIPMIHIYASKPAVKKYIGWPLMQTPEDTAKYIKTLIERHEAGTHVYASVVERVSGTVVGTAMIFGFDKAANHGEIGYVLDDTVWGKGYGTQVVSMLCQYALKDLALRKVFARIVASNIGSARVLEKNGFQVEAVLKEYYKIDDRYADCIYYSRYGV